MDDIELLTISTAARVLNRSVFTLRQWERQGKLVPIRDSGGRRLYNAEEVHQMAASMTPRSGADFVASADAPGERKER